VRLPTLNPPLAGLIGLVIAAAICFWPGGIALFAVAMWGGFSPSVGIAWKTVLGVTLAIIAAAFFFLARSIARGLSDT